MSQKQIFFNTTALLVPIFHRVGWAYNAQKKKKCFKVQNLDIVAHDASFANALSNVEPHQHLGGHQPVP